MNNKFIKIIGIGVVIVFLMFLGIQYLEYRTQAEAIVKTTDESKTVDLVDGSTVVLAPNSTIKYSNYFNEKGRFVELTKGSATFMVVEEKGIFRVKTEREIITVLGTVFDVDFGESQTVITVTEGKVNVRQNATKQGQIEVKSIKVTAGEQAISKKDFLELRLDK